TGTLTNLAHHFFRCPHITGFVCTISQVQHHFCKTHFNPIDTTTAYAVTIRHRFTCDCRRGEALAVDSPIGTFGTATNRSSLVSPLPPFRIPTQNPGASIIGKG